MIFTLEEVGPNPDAFGTGTAIVNEVPEPGSLVLISSGVAFFWVSVAETQTRGLRLAGLIGNQGHS